MDSVQRARRRSTQGLVFNGGPKVSKLKGCPDRHICPLYRAFECDSAKNGRGHCPKGISDR